MSSTTAITTLLRIMQRSNSIRMTSIGVVDETNLTFTRVLRDINIRKEAHLAEKWHKGSVALPLLRSAGIVNTINNNIFGGKQRNITERKRIRAEARVATEREVHTITIDSLATLADMTHTKTEAGAPIIGKGAQLHKGGLPATMAL